MNGIFGTTSACMTAAARFRPAVSMLAYKDQLYIGTDNGVVLTFNTDRIKGRQRGIVRRGVHRRRAAHLLVLDHAV